MKRLPLFSIAAAMTFAALPAAHGQRGMGDPTGVARRVERPPLVSLEGTLVAIATGPCERTTGRSPLGTHLRVRTADDQTLDVHLGPSFEVAEMVEKLAPGQKLAIRAFRTEQMPEGAYVAQSVAIEGATLAFRDAQTLQPVWARPAGFGRGRGAGAGGGGGGGGWRGGRGGGPRGYGGGGPVALHPDGAPPR